MKKNACQVLIGLANTHQLIEQGRHEVKAISITT
jgi:hypothetical protein